MSKYVEATWFMHDRTIILSGHVEGDEVRCFSAETEDGEPVKIPDAFIVDAIQDLVEAAELSS